MNAAPELSVVIPTCPPRREKLAALLRGVAASEVDRRRFEVILVVDDEDPAPLELARAALPAGVHLVGLTQEKSRCAPPRNVGIAQARGAWLLMLDDDMRIDAHTVAAHLAAIERDPRAARAYLGRIDLPPERLDSPWTALQSQTPMTFFWNTIRPGRTYGFRYFWTCHVSVRTDLVRSVGGFNEALGRVIHEDIELGWRMQRQCGLEIEPLPEAAGWHDHPLTPYEYLHREHRSGTSAAAAKPLNPEFHDAVWSSLGDPAETLGVLQRLFMLSARQTLAQFERWAAEPLRRPAPEELHSVYLAHLPLKRMTFCQGYLGRSFDDWWAELSDRTDATTPAPPMQQEPSACRA